MALLAAFGAKSILENIRWGQTNLKSIIGQLSVVLLLANAVYSIVGMVRYHPHEDLYFNRLAGKSLKAVKQNYELDYWGLAYVDGYTELLERDSSESIKVIGPGGGCEFSIRMLTAEQRKRVTYTSVFDDADYFIGNYRTHPKPYPYGSLLFTIDIDETSILEVRKLK